MKRGARRAQALAVLAAMAVCTLLAASLSAVALAGGEAPRPDVTGTLGPAPRPTVPGPAPASISLGGSTAKNACGVERLEMTLQRFRRSDGQLVGKVLFWNRSDAPCTLGGWPRTVELVDARGRSLPVARRTITDSVPYSVEIRPGDAAWSEIRWLNWCGGPDYGSPISLVVTLPGSRAETRAPVPGQPPFCNLPAGTSWLRVGSFRVDDLEVLP